METTGVVANSGVVREEKRSLRWIDPKFQRQYAFLLLSIVLLVSSVLIGTFWFHSEQVLNTLANAGVLKQHALYILIEKQMASLLLSVIVVVSLFSIFVLVMASFLSHRIVGPMFAIKRSLDRIGDGQVEDARLNLRADDEFQDVAQLVNRVVDRLQGKS